MKKGKYSYFVEKKALETTERPRKFLEAFAAILEHSNYGLPLEVYARISTKCSRCAFVCPLYEVTGEDRDIPCHRSELLLGVYRRYFTAAGILKARMFGGFTLTDEYLDRMAEEFYRCTACRRCKATCPMG
ncbi:MAG TPA: 4Fe-4S dicluster domain-containing protein, partial [Candidatus Deferrimicrobiaceae bacterium]|nr:4Fe-4S dicluster domain-containing protein [Candidatus Deferrimicrobiaceae bacterium]